jgi:hypothetical protein
MSAITTSELGSYTVNTPTDWSAVHSDHTHSTLTLMEGSQLTKCQKGYEIRALFPGHTTLDETKDWRNLQKFTCTGTHGEEGPKSESHHDIFSTEVNAVDYAQAAEED